MAKQTFTTGQVLLASQLTSLQQTAMLGGSASNKTSSYTLVAADAGTAISMTSTSATTITVNTGLFAAGDTVQITNLSTGVTTITAGTATVNTSASLALAQYESGTLNFTSTSAAIFIKGDVAAAASGGITLISETVASALSSLSLSSIPSTYKHLQLTWHGITQSAQNSSFGIRFNNNSTADTYQGKMLAFQPTLNFTTFSYTDCSFGVNEGSTPFGAAGTSSTNLQKNPQGTLTIYNYASATKLKFYELTFGFNDINDTKKMYIVQGTFNDVTAISSIDVFRSTGSDTFSNASNTSIRLYGLS
jgi:hypothetical protein